MDFPTKQYDIIYADPPWAHIGVRIGSVNHIETPYMRLSTDELCDLPIQSINSDNCLLFMWAASPMLTDAIRVGEAWGFQYKTIAFVWDKQNPVIGYYTMSQCEMCLVFKKGKIPQPRGKTNIRQFLTCKKSRHSEKPWEVRDRITEMFPAQRKLEMFARTQHKGWDAWGNELDKEIDLS